MRLTPGWTMLFGLLAMAGVIGLGAYLTGHCQSQATPERPYRLAHTPSDVVYCGPTAGPILAACPLLFAVGGGIFILGALWLGWREGRSDDPSP